MISITVNIKESDYKIFCHEIIDPQVWVECAIAGKINSIKKRLVPEVVNKMISDPDITTIPANKDEICNYEFSKENYKNAAERKEQENN